MDEIHQDDKQVPMMHVQSVISSNTNATGSVIPGSQSHVSQPDSEKWAIKETVPLHQEIVEQRRSESMHMLGDLDMSSNKLYLTAVILLLNLPGLVIGYALGYQNNLTPCIEAKFGWADGYEKDIHNSLLGSSLMLGMTIGAVSGGVMMQIGRRKSMFICLVFGLIGNFLTIDIHNFGMIIIGRLLFGFSSGLYSSIVPKMFSETIPQHVLASVVASFCTSQAFATYIAFQLGAILPEDTDYEALKNTDRWLVFYIYVPVAMQILFLLSLLFVLKYEPIKFLIQQERMEEAIEAVKLMYKHAVDDESAMKYIQKIKQNSGSKSSNLTLSDALFNPQYRTATWINVGYIIFHELTGINVINLYCNTIFKSMDEDGSGFVTPRQGVYLVGVSTFLASFMSTQTIRFFGRKPLLIFGHLGIAVVHALVAIFNIHGVNTGVVLMILLFIFVYQNTSGPIAWVYASETVIDTAMGICLLTLWGTVLVLSIICPIIMDPSSLGPNGTFFIFSGISVFGALYVIVFIKETYGLQDREKKLIFTPKQFRGGTLDER